MAAKDEFGRAGEQRAAEHLAALGYTILARNWRCEHGEIDIVASDSDALCVVEVKTRRSERFGHPFEAIDDRKRRRLWRLAFAWVQDNPRLAANRRVRLEAVGLTGPDVDTARIEHLVDLV